jgi:hypothetical protein
MPLLSDGRGIGRFWKAERFIYLGSMKVVDSCIFGFETICPPMTGTSCKNDPGLLTYLAILRTDIIIRESSSTNLSRSKNPFLSWSVEVLNSVEGAKTV